MIITFDIDFLFPNNKSRFDFYLDKTFQKQSSEINLFNLNLFKDVIKNKKFIILGTHDEIIKYIKPYDEVLNIDHHHDLLYDIEDKDEVINNWNNLFDETKEATWAYYCIHNKKIKYYWCGNKDSYVNIELYGINFNQIDKKDIYMFLKKTDIIYLIKSRNYVTDKQLSIVEEIINEESY